MLCWRADLAEVLKGVRALAPNDPDIAVAMDSNQQLVDNYIKVTLFSLQAHSVKFTCWVRSLSTAAQQSRTSCHFTFVTSICFDIARIWARM